MEEKDGDIAVQGEGTEILATWKPDERTFAAQTPDDLKYEDVPVEVRARADSYLIQGAKVPYEISSEFDVPGAERLQIVKRSIIPEEPFEDPGVPVEVKADIFAIGLDIVEDDIEWKVSIMDPEGRIIESLKHFTMGFGPEVVAQWDGKVDGQFKDNASYHSFFIEATGCEGGGGTVIARTQRGVLEQETDSDRLCVNPNKIITIRDPEEVLNVFASASIVNGTPQARRLIGSSVGPGSPRIVELLSNVSLDRYVDLEMIHPPDGIKTATGVITTGKGSTAKFELKVSRNGSFEATSIPIPDSLLTTNRPDFTTLEQGYETVDSFHSFLSGFQSFSGFPSPRLSRGRGYERLPSFDELGAFFRELNCLTRRDTIKACGFEKARATVTYKDPKTGEAKELLADFKVRETASIVHWLGRGTAEFLFESTTSGNSGFISANDMFLEEVRLLILSGTDGLEVRNFDISTNSPKGDSDVVQHGKTWENRRANGAIYLGYRLQAPSRAIYTKIFPKFLSELQRLEARGQSNSIRWAWLLANSTEGDGRSACVLDSGGFHYIHGGWTFDEEGRFAVNRRVWSTDLDLVSVAKAHWSMDGDSSSKKPGEKIAIPSKFPTRKVRDFK